MRPVLTFLKPLLVHSLAWLGFILYEQSILLVLGTGRFSVIDTGLTFILNAGLFYANYLLLLPRLYARRQYVAYVLGVAALLSLFALVRYFLNLHVFPFLLHQPVPTISSYTILWAQALYRGVYFILLSFGYWFARNAVRLEKQKLRYEHEQRVAEKSLMEANLAFLKNQINPHFLFNSLNFLYSQVHKHSEEAAKGILILSDIMRYALQEEDNGKAMLETEVQHLHNYIAINQLRFSNRLQIKFAVVGNLQFRMILPLILITFVENCLKHGELSDPNDPLLITITIVDNHLTFYTHNRKRNGPKEKSMGIGLQNTRRRLDMMYQDRYTLWINDAQNYYTCTLTMEL